MTLKFKTNINCGSCIQKVSPFLNELEGVDWVVDTTEKDKILTVEGNQVDQEAVIRKVKEAGYEVEPRKKGLINKWFGN